MQFFKEVNVRGRSRRVPKLWIIALVFFVVVSPAAWMMYRIVLPKEKPITRTKGKLTDNVSPLAANREGITAAIRQREQQEQAAAQQQLPPEAVSIKRGITKPEQRPLDKKRSDEAKKIEFYQSTAGLGEKKQTEGGEDLSRLPLWQRYKKGGMQAATNSASNHIAAGSGSNPLQGGNGSQPGATGPQIQPEDTLRQILSQKKPTIVWGQVKNAPTHTDEPKQSEVVSEHFLPPAQMIPVTIITGINTRGRGNGKVLVQVARPVIAQHNLQLLTTTRILCSVGGEILTDKEDISRIPITPEKIIYPNGSWLQMPAASFYDARDRAYGVIAKRYVPPLWNRLLPIALANFSSAALNASREQVGTDVNGRPIYGNSIGNVLRSASAETIGGANSLPTDYVNRLLSENQPYSVIKPGTSAFIMLDDSIDLSKATRNGAPTQSRGSAANTIPDLGSLPQGLDSSLLKEIQGLGSLPASVMSGLGGTQGAQPPTQPIPLPSK